jgi:predicted MFS family arabinose efflux permease
MTLFGRLQRKRSWLPVTLVAAALMSVSMGGRQTLGLFVSPLNTSTGLGIVAISFAMAVGQFAWGAAQPVAGAFADRYGPQRVLAAGIVLIVLGAALTPLVHSTAGLVVTLGLLSAIGAGAASFPVVLGAVSRNLPVETRGTVAGIINAGGSFGQFVFAPLLQTLISAFGWMAAMWSLAAITLAALPLISRVRPAAQPEAHAAGAAAADRGLGRALRDALGDRNYLLLHAGFFTCGFHIAFLVTHLPGEVALCGLPPSVASASLAIIGLANIAGSLASGAFVNRWRSKYVLFWVYGSRAVMVLLYLAAPRTAWTFYLFAGGLGFTWLATVPPTAGVVGKLFGMRYLATLFGLTLLSHQIGGFLGAWLGGLAIAHTGSYQWMWYADASLATLAALCNLPIREPHIQPRAAPA